MTETPEMDRLTERLKGAKNFHVDWGPEAWKMTREERAAELNRALDSLENLDCDCAPPDSGQPQVDIRAFASALNKPPMEARFIDGWMTQQYEGGYRPKYETGGCSEERQ
jgi:hypothetical protein